MENRRKHKRFKLLQVVEISYLSGEAFIDASLLDISVTGIKCELKHPIKSGSEIFVMFEIPNKDATQIIKCYCDVSWQKKIEDSYQAGLFFKFLDKKEVELLDNYLNSL